jgi:hypothetical protein
MRQLTLYCIGAALWHCVRPRLQPLSHTTLNHLLALMS